MKTFAPTITSVTVSGVSSPDTVTRWGSQEPCPSTGRSRGPRVNESGDENFEKLCLMAMRHLRPVVGKQKSRRGKFSSSPARFCVPVFEIQRAE